MHINPKKCNKTTISRSTKALSKLTTSDNLKQDAHINRVDQKANQFIRFLCRNLNHSQQTLKESAYKSLVSCSLESYSSIWNPDYTKNIKHWSRYKDGLWGLSSMTAQGSLMSLLWSLTWDGTHSSVLCWQYILKRLVIWSILTHPLFTYPY